MALALVLSVFGGLSAVTPQAGAAARGDDYPYRGGAIDVPDPWGALTRECTSFVAWRLAQDGNTTRMNWGNAGSWADTARAKGYAVDGNPVVGAVAWWGPGQGGAGSFGHVAWVAAVNGDGSVNVEEYNFFNAYSYGARNNVRASAYIHVRDVPSGGIGDGSFVRTPDGAVYRIAGGAPLYVSSWANIGGPQSVVNVASLSQFRTTPVDGYFIRGLPGGQIYRVAGGAPIYVSSWANIGGPQNFLDVDQAAIDNAGAGGVYNHLNAKPTDGYFIRGLPGGQIYRVAGGAPIYVSSWANIGGPQNFLDVDQAAIDNAGAGGVYNHLNAKPTDGYFIRGLPGGQIYRVAGGAPIYVSSWANIGGPQNFLDVDQAAIDNAGAGGVYNHLNAKPTDGYFIRGLPGGSIYRVAGGAPIYVSTWSAFAGVQPWLDVDQAAIDNAGSGGVYAHLGLRPVDGTVLTGLPGGSSYRVTAGVAVPLHTHPAGVGVDQVSIGNAGGAGVWSHLAKGGTGFHAVVPARLLDSRTATGGWNAKLAAGAPRSLTVAGGAVPASVSAVVVNVTVTNASAGSFLTVYPTGSAVPNASNINFGAGQTIPNLVTVKVGTGGQVSFANATGAVDVIADVVGWYDDGTTPGDGFHGTTPTRLLDSRTATGGWNTRLVAGMPRDLKITGGPVPSTATAVVMNVTVTNANAASFVQAWPAGATRPNSSNVNFGAGQTIANLVTVQIGTGGQVSFATATGTVDVIADVVGYYDPTDGTGTRFHPLNPTRVLDDRTGTGLAGPWNPGQSRAFSIAGTAAVPAGASSVVLNTTVTNSTTGSYITIYADSTTKPSASNLNFGPYQTIANLAITNIGTNGKVAIYNALGNVDIIADTTGYYTTT